VKGKPLIRLRPVTGGDFAFLATLRRDQSLQELLLNHPSPETVKDPEIENWIQRRKSEPGGTFQVVVDADEARLGFVQIFDVRLRSRHGKLGMALISGARAQGAGREALQLLCMHARDVLQLHKLLLEVRIDNLIATRLYESSGFQKIGILRQHYFDGNKYHDVLLMERFLDEDRSS